MQICNKEEKIMNTIIKELEYDESYDDKYNDEYAYPFKCQDYILNSGF